MEASSSLLLILLSSAILGVFSQLESEQVFLVAVNITNQTSTAPETGPVTLVPGNLRELINKAVIRNPNDTLETSEERDQQKGSVMTIIGVVAGILFGCTMLFLLYRRFSNDPEEEEKKKLKGKKKKNKKHKKKHKGKKHKKKKPGETTEQVGADIEPVTKSITGEPGFPPTTTPVEKKKPGLLDRIARKPDKTPVMKSMTGEPTFPPTTAPVEKKKLGLLDFIARKRTSSSPEHKEAKHKLKKGKKRGKDNKATLPKKSTLFKKEMDKP